MKEDAHSTFEETLGFPGASDSEESAWKLGDPDPWARKIP